MNPVRLFLVHENPLHREALSRSLEAHAEVELIGSLSRSQVANERLRRDGVDLVLVDASIEQEAALEVTRNLRRRFPGLRLLPLGLEGGADVVRFIEAGANGYLLQDASLAELIRTAVDVYRGRPPCSSRVADMVRLRIVELSRSAPRLRAPTVALTKRENEILEQVADGLGNQEIALELGIALATVKNHVHRILDKLGARSRREAVRVAFENGLLKGVARLRPRRRPPAS
ncbi:MAG: response regulator transcription factor [Acidobacteriota bacterium]